MRRRTVAAGFFSLAVALVPIATSAQLAAAPSSSAALDQAAPIGEDLSDRGLVLCESVLVPWMSAVPAIGIDAAALPGLAGNRFGGYLRIPESTRPSCDATVRDGAVLSAARVFVIGGAGSRIFASAAERNPAGRREVELGDLRLPFVRVGFAPSSQIEIEAVVNRRPRLGIFNALFTTAGSRQRTPEPSAVAAVTQTRKTSGMPSPPALELPLLAAFRAPIEERSVPLRPLPPAPIEERTVVVLPPTPIEERVILARALIPAAVEERLIVPAAAPVEERVVVAAALIPAAVEERVIAPVRASQIASVQVASAAPVPVIVVAAPDKPAEKVIAKPAGRAFKEITIAAPPPRLIQNMFDRRGGSFFM